MSKENHGHIINFMVDAESVETHTSDLTVREILGLAGIDADTHYLRLVTGNHQQTYSDLNESLHVHEHERFISVFHGPTPVS